ncbi:MAG: hypothetical protein WD825_03925 [Gemmatimonadaceae bacterium]
MSDDTDQPSTADHVGQAAGGITGVLAGAAIGSTAGPIGTLLGGVAGAIGGWWSGRAIAEAAEDITSADDQYFRDHFASTGDARRTYDDAQAAYYLGHVAAANRDYSSFDQVETELSRGWNSGAKSQGEWHAVRDYASVGFDRGRERRRKPRHE